MADKKQQQKEQLRVRLKAAKKNKVKSALEKDQRAAGRVTVKMISEARKNKAKNYDQLVTKYKTQESLDAFLDKRNKARRKAYTTNLPKI
tara:strand:- start:8 stop:277 length:270 start_codon:yes stop_codon:yes gene_type:complete